MAGSSNCSATGISKKVCPCFNCSTKRNNAALRGGGNRRDRKGTNPHGDGRPNQKVILTHMQKIILIKQHPSVQFAHLYEHLFCTQIKKLLYSHDLYKYLDFSLSGTTFNQGGLIEIDIELYTPEATSLSKQLLDMRLTFDEDTILNAYNQLIAEEEQSVHTEDLSTLIQALTGLDSQPWQTIDDFEIFDAKNIRRTLLPVYLTNKRRLPARNLTLTLPLDQKFSIENRELLPLFWTLSKVLLFRIQDDLALSQAYYADGVTLDHSSRQVSHQAMLKVAHGRSQTIDITQDLQQSLEVIADMVRNRMTDRLCQMLNTISYTQDLLLAPDTQAYFEKTGIYIGSVGWRKIATPENCELLLEHMSIGLRFGNNKTTHSILG